MLKPMSLTLIWGAKYNLQLCIEKITHFRNVKIFMKIQNVYKYNPKR